MQPNEKHGRDDVAAPLEVPGEFAHARLSAEFVRGYYPPVTLREYSTIEGSALASPGRLPG